jgi:hypothetical protein
MATGNQSNPVFQPWKIELVGNVSKKIGYKEAKKISQIL